MESTKRWQWDWYRHMLGTDSMRKLTTQHRLKLEDRRGQSPLLVNVGKQSMWEVNYEQWRKRWTTSDHPHKHWINYPGIMRGQHMKLQKDSLEKLSEPWWDKGTPIIIPCQEKLKSKTAGSAKRDARSSFIVRASYFWVADTSCNQSSLSSSILKPQSGGPRTMDANSFNIPLHWVKKPTAFIIGTGKIFLSEGRFRQATKRQSFGTNTESPAGWRVSGRRQNQY